MEYRDPAPPTSAALVRENRVAIAAALGYWWPRSDVPLLLSQFPVDYSDQLVAMALFNWLLVVLAIAVFVPCCCTRLASELLAAVGARICVSCPRVRTTYAHVRWGPFELPGVFYRTTVLSEQLRCGYCCCVDFHLRPQREWPLWPGVHAYTATTSVRARRSAYDAALARSGDTVDAAAEHDGAVLDVTGQCDEFALPLCVCLPPCVCGWLIYRCRASSSAPDDDACVGDGDDTPSFRLPSTTSKAVEVAGAAATPLHLPPLRTGSSPPMDLDEWAALSSPAVMRERRKSFNEALESFGNFSPTAALQPPVGMPLDVMSPQARSPASVRERRKSFTSFTDAMSSFGDFQVAVPSPPLEPVSVPVRRKSLPGALSSSSGTQSRGATLWGKAGVAMHAGTFARARARRHSSAALVSEATPRVLPPSKAQGFASAEAPAVKLRRHSISLASLTEAPPLVGLGLELELFASASDDAGGVTPKNAKKVTRSKKRRLTRSVSAAFARSSSSSPRSSRSPRRRRGSAAETLMHTRRAALKWQKRSQSSPSSPPRARSPSDVSDAGASSPASTSAEVSDEGAVDKYEAEATNVTDEGEIHDSCHEESVDTESENENENEKEVELEDYEMTERAAQEEEHEEENEWEEDTDDGVEAEYEYADEVEQHEEQDAVAEDEDDEEKRCAVEGQLGKHAQYGEAAEVNYEAWEEPTASVSVYDVDQYEYEAEEETTDEPFDATEDDLDVDADEEAPPLRSLGLLLGPTEADGEDADLRAMDEVEAGQCVTCMEERTPSGSERLLTVFSQLVLLAALLLCCCCMFSGAIWGLTEAAKFETHAAHLAAESSCATKDIGATMDHMLIPLGYAAQHSAGMVADSLEFVAAMERGNLTGIVSELRAIASTIESDTCGAKSEIAAAMHTWKEGICLVYSGATRDKCKLDIQAVPAEQITPMLSSAATAVRSSAAAIENGAANSVSISLDAARIRATSQLSSFRDIGNTTLLQARAALLEIKMMLRGSTQQETSLVENQIKRWVGAGTALLVLDFIAVGAIAIVLLASAAALCVCTAVYRRERDDASHANLTLLNEGETRRGSMGPSVHTVVASAVSDSATWAIDAARAAMQERKRFDCSERRQCWGTWTLRVTSWIAWVLSVATLTLAAYTTAASVAISDGCTVGDALAASNEMVAWMNRSSTLDSNEALSTLGSCFRGTSAPLALGIVPVLDSIRTLNFSSADADVTHAFDSAAAALEAAMNVVSAVDFTRYSNATAVGLLAELNRVTASPFCNPRPNAGQLRNYTLFECTPNVYHANAADVPLTTFSMTCATDQDHSLMVAEKTNGKPYGGCCTRFEMAREALVALQSRIVCSATDIISLSARVGALQANVTLHRARLQRDQARLISVRTLTRPLADNFAQLEALGDCTFARGRLNSLLNRACGPALDDVVSVHRVLLIVAALLLSSTLLSQVLAKRLLKFQPNSWHFGKADVALDASVVRKNRRKSFELFASGSLSQRPSSAGMVPNPMQKQPRPGSDVRRTERRPSMQYASNPMMQRRQGQETTASDVQIQQHHSKGAAMQTERRRSVQYASNPMVQERRASQCTKPAAQDIVDDPLVVASPTGTHMRSSSNTKLSRLLSKRSSSRASLSGNPLSPRNPVSATIGQAPERRISLQFQENPMGRMRK